MIKPHATRPITECVSELTISREGAVREGAATPVLVVDDGRHNREVLAGILEVGGYEPLVAESGEDGLRLARARRPSLIVTDLLMPGMNGFELVRKVRDEPDLASIPVIFWTGHYNDRETRRLAEGLGVAGLLPKPCGMSAALELIGAAIEGAAAPSPAAPSPATTPQAFNLEHARVLNDKLVETAGELETARDALRESEARFRALVSNIPGAVYRRRLDSELTVEFVSDRMEDVTGYPAAAFIDGGERSYASIIHPDDRNGVLDDIRAAVDADCHYGLAYRVVRLDGSEMWVGDRGQAVTSADGAGATWLYGTITDISERKRLESERDHMELELRVAQKLEAVGQLAAGVAHEINTPVQFVGDSVHFLKDCFDDLERLLAEYRAVAETAAAANPLLRERLARADEEADLEYLRDRIPGAFGRTLEGVERVASIVRAMKEFAHPQTEQAPANLNRALETTLTVARNEYKYVADVVTELGTLPDVICNASDLNQVFLNLIVNAAHAIHDAAPGGERGTITIRTEQDGDAVTITVADTGSGIPEHVRTRVFDPFFTTKEVGRGTGQGLAISRAIVDKHGGTLTFETEVGRGTTFVVRLPVGGVPALDGSAP